MQAQLPIKTEQVTPRFPFGLDDLKSWTVKRTDGTATRYVLSTQGTSAHTGSSSHESNSTQRSISSYSSYCAHTPKETPVASFPRPDGEAELRFWVANMSGARQTRDAFNFVVDCGDILTLTSRSTAKYLEGDEELASALEPFVTAAPPARILKIDWEDRAAPLLDPGFWTELNKLLYGDVMTCCVGGHGRSGTSFVCLLMVNAPDYDALDAIVHCRAVHCPRAIESVVQHEYIDEVAKHLGRQANAKSANTITNYKEAFMNSKKPTAIRTRKELGWDKK